MTPEPTRPSERESEGWGALEWGLVAAILLAGLIGLAFLLSGTRPSSQPLSEASDDPPVVSSDAAVCSALSDFDRHKQRFESYLGQLEGSDAQAVSERHGQLLDAMLATANRLYEGSSDESQFSELELAIGDWMQAVDAGMVMIDSGFRTGDSGYFDDAERDLRRAADAEATIDRLRGQASC